MKATKRMSLCGAILSNMDDELKDRILKNFKLGNEAFTRFKENERKEAVKQLTDLFDMKSKTESEVYEVLNRMVKNDQYFMYCGPILININPGPNKIKDYLNLKSWVTDTEGKDESEWKPHLYTFMYYVYQALITEKKDQVVNMMGQIGSGKTFNIIHIFEYFCCMVGPDKFQIETFDTIHKSIQLIHIMGSIFRQNNLESTSCGMLLKLGFGEDNKICFFDIEAKILDCTLPFSENGRSYSILHSLISCASDELKRNFFLPDEDYHLNFFRKFSKNFNKKTKERFKLNDYEIWNRFHTLLNFFDFSKNEIVELLEIFGFILNINELGMAKSSLDKTEKYEINKGQSSKKLSKLLNADEDEFIKTMGSFKELTDIKNTLISLMKFSYYIAFEYILKKIKIKLRLFFNNIYSQKHSKIGSKNINNLNNNMNTNNTNNNDTSRKNVNNTNNKAKNQKLNNNNNSNNDTKNNFNFQLPNQDGDQPSTSRNINRVRTKSTESNQKNTGTNISKLDKIKLLLNLDNVKFIYFIDAPGEVEDQTLGGMITNLANECLSLYAGNSYSIIVEKLLKEKVFKKLFKPLHSYHVVRSIMGEKGLIYYLSNAFTQENYNMLRKDVLKKNYYKKCVSFQDIESAKSHDDFRFCINYSHMKVLYNYESIYLETKSLVNINKTYKIFSLSKNSIIKSIYIKLIDNNIDFYTFIYNSLMAIFEPIKGINPFVIYCLHSNNSYKLFFGNDKDKDYNIPSSRSNKEDKNWVIPRTIVVNLLKKSICVPVLYWEWFGFHEWVEITDFVKEFEDDFYKLFLKIKARKKYNNNEDNATIADLNNFKRLGFFEKATEIINNLNCSRNAIFGKQYILMKKGTFLRAKNTLYKLLTKEENEAKQIAMYSKNTKDNKLSLQIQKKLDKKPVVKKNSKNPAMNNSKLQGDSKRKYSDNTSKQYDSKSNHNTNNNVNTNNNNSNNVSINNNNTNNNNVSLNVNSNSIYNNNLTKSFTINTEDLYKAPSRNTLCKLYILKLNEKNESDDVNKSKDLLSKLLDSTKQECSKYNLYKIFEKNVNDGLESVEELSNSDYGTDAKDNKDKDKDLKAYRKKHNIVVPTQDRFNMVQNLFDFNKNTNFNVFDYTKVIPEIVKIQSMYRAFKGREKYYLLKYIMMMIIKIQKWIRGFLTKQKLKRLKKCLNCIIFIQQIYRQHFNSMNGHILLIQNKFRQFKAKNKYLRRKKRLEDCLQNGEEFLTTSDEEELKKWNIYEKKKKKDQNKAKDDKETINKLMNFNNTNRNKISLLPPMTSSTKNKNKNRSQDKSSRYITTNSNGPKSFRSSSNEYNGKFMKRPEEKMKKAEEDVVDIGKEKDKDKIISLILLDNELMRQNEKMNRQLANQKGVSKDVKYELLRIDKDEVMRTRKNLMNNDKKVVRIEDKLIEYGNILKQKRALERVNRYKNEGLNFTFVPNVNKKIPEYLKEKNESHKNNNDNNQNNNDNNNNNNHNNNNNNKKSDSKERPINKDFFDRLNYYENQKKNKLLNIKVTSTPEIDESEYTYRPKISETSSKMKRNINDLYNWDKNRMKKIKQQEEEKAKRENEQMNKNTNFKYVSGNSMMILQKKNKNNNNNTNINNTNNKNTNTDNNNLDSNNNDNDKINTDNINEKNEDGQNNNNNDFNATTENGNYIDLWPEDNVDKRYVPKVEIDDNNKKEASAKDTETENAKKKDADDDEDEEEVDDFN